MAALHAERHDGLVCRVLMRGGEVLEDVLVGAHERGAARARTDEFKRRQEAGDDLPSAPRGPRESAEGAEVQERVQSALLALPEDLRVAIVLYDIEGQAYRDIAEALDIPEGTVKSRIHRARNALRTELADYVKSSAGDES